MGRMGGCRGALWEGNLWGAPENDGKGKGIYGVPQRTMGRGGESVGSPIGCWNGEGIYGVPYRVIGGEGERESMGSL